MPNVIPLLIISAKYSSDTSARFPKYTPKCHCLESFLCKVTWGQGLFWHLRLSQHPAVMNITDSRSPEFLWHSLRNCIECGSVMLWLIHDSLSEVSQLWDKYLLLRGIVCSICWQVFVIQSWLLLPTCGSGGQVTLGVNEESEWHCQEQSHE